MKNIKDIISLIIIGAAAILSAHNGSINWMGWIVLAIILQIPGWRSLKSFFLKALKLMRGRNADPE